jgi:Uncharacterised conserved protein (DUF2228)
MRCYSLNEILSVLFRSVILSSLDAKTPGMRQRDRQKVSVTFHGAGMVVPYDKKTQVSHSGIDGFSYRALMRAGALCNYALTEMELRHYPGLWGTHFVLF